ncbi:putative reverse transcriptase domain-containing protein [Tanacetum coccineum]|uniref:Reverse transcriptase domain-containing protein n=1 Tax=Tanacetum coccineum TaxID=301880 RepID=A0ABQ5A894_9ASTR
MEWLLMSRGHIMAHTLNLLNETSIMWEIVQAVTIAGRRVILPRYARIKMEMATMEGDSPAMNTSLDYLQNVCPRLNRAPNNNNNNAGNPRAPTRDQVHAIRAEEVVQNQTMVTGTFLLNGYFISVLFDYKADRSFVSLENRPLLEHKYESLDEAYTIEYANGNEYEAREILLNCRLNLNDELFNIDLILIELKNFDVVIGMDWLTKVQADIKCFDKIIRIPLKCGKTLIVQGDKPARNLKIVSAIKMHNYLKKDCFAFLAHVVEKDRKVKIIQDILVVKNYPEVFPEDLPGPPPSRQVEFLIDLVPGAAPVAKAPYRLAQPEIQDLSAQLQELLSKGLIRPSSSLWGEPVLFVKKKDGSMRMPYLDKFVIVFIDDILIYSHSKAEHEQHLNTILSLLKDEKLFIKDFSKIAKPLTKLTHKTKKFVWEKEQEEAFQTLKNKLCDAPILSLPEGSENFVVYCDTSYKGLGCVLMQRDKVIAYESRQLKKHKKNYMTHDLELEAVTSLISHILEAQWEAMKEENLKEETLFGANEKLKTGADGIKYLNGRAWIPKVNNLRKVVMDEAHRSRYSIYPEVDKMYMDVKEYYRWSGMKRDIAIYVEKCLTCAKVKAEHKKPSGLLQQPKIPYAHFLPIQEDYLLEKFAKLYINEIVSKHGVPLSIISDRDGRFRSRFWRLLQKALGTQLDMSTAYYPQTDGQSKRMIQTLEDMLRTHVIDLGVGDQVPLKVSPWKDTIRFGKQGKLNPRYNGPFKVLDKVGLVAYRLELPQELDGIHNVFHVSILKKCLTDEMLVVTLKELKITDKLQFIEEIFEIMDQDIKSLK